MSMYRADLEKVKKVWGRTIYAGNINKIATVSSEDINRILAEIVNWDDILTEFDEELIIWVAIDYDDEEPSLYMFTANENLVAPWLIELSIYKIPLNPLKDIVPLQEGD
jgi:hypothetical protein